MRSAFERAAVLALALAALAPAAAGDGERPAPGTLPGAADAVARYVETRGHVVVVELAGDYDRHHEGELNAYPRALVARELFAHHPDGYDFLVVFTGFEIDTGEARAFHLGVRNDVLGIGLPAFDESALYGSDGRLQGYVDMAALTRHVTDPLQPGFEDTLTTLAHELLHQWAAHVRFRLPDGSLSDALLGRDGSHWSDLLDSDASVLYGNDWRPNGDGTFTSAAALDFFSPLDLYLAGYLAPEEVPPFVLLEAPGEDPTRLPRPGARIAAVPRVVTIDDVIAAEGPRVPAAGEARRDLRAAFVLVVRPGDTVTEAQIAALDRVRRALGDRFAVLTGGRGVLEVYPAAMPVGEPGAPPPVAGGPTRPTEASLADALAWLRARQGADGSWADRAATMVRDTAAALAALVSLDPQFAGETQAVGWLGGQPAATTDHRARTLAALAARGRPTAAGAAALAAEQNADGGWGLVPGYASDPLDTALALGALAAAGAAPAGLADRAAGFLAAARGPDGGWGPLPGGAGRAGITAAVLRALRAAGRGGEANDPGFAFLAARQNADGGFGDSPSTAHDTAEVLETAVLAGAGGAFDLGAGAGYLRSRQGLDGSWEGSVYATARVVSALRRLDFPNLALRSFAAEPADPRDGERVRLRLTIANDGHLSAPASVLRVSLGEPGVPGSETLAELDVPPVPPGQAVEVTAAWDTLDRAGEHLLVAVADAAAALAELSESDNRAALTLAVLPAPDGVDLALAAADVLISPAAPATLPADLAVSAVVRNVGLVDAPEVHVDLLEIAEDGSLLPRGRVTVAVPSRSSTAASFTVPLARAGTTRFAVVADPDGLVAEADEENNRAEAAVTTAAAVELAVTGLTRLGSSALVGQDVSFEVTVENRGTVESPPTELRTFLRAGDETLELRRDPLQLAAGETAVRTVVWRVDRAGSLEIVAEIDPFDAVAEGDETDNAASLAFAAGEIDQPNLTLGRGDLVVEPLPALEGRPLRLTAHLRNTGAQPLADVAVGFYAGNPAQGAPSLAAPVVVASLAPGESAPAVVEVERWPRAGEWLIYAVADPGDELAELFEDDNAVFEVFDALALPDLAIDAGSLDLQPRFPRPGETVTLSVTVTNLGEQPSAPVAVRLWDGDPAAGGTPLAADAALAPVAPGEVGTATFAWSFAAVASGSLVVEVDPAATADEGSRLNNRAALEVAAQDGDFYVGQRYFSPNGDGVQDATDFFFRLAAPLAVAVEVVDRHDRVVRRQPLGAAAEAGHFHWNGLDALGRVANDGDYRLRAVDASGAVLGQAVATLDTDRSSLLDAEGTPFGRFTNLTCFLDFDVDFAFYDDDARWAYFWGGTGSLAQPFGIYRIDGRGQDLQLVREDGDWVDAVSGDGSLVAFRAFGPNGYTLRVIRGEGVGEVELGPYEDDGYAFTRDNRHLVSFGSDWWNDEQTIELIPVDGGPARVLATFQQADLDTWKGVSPDTTRMVFHNWSGGETGDEIWFLDLESGASRKLREVIWPGYSWSPDGSRFLVLDDRAGSVFLYDRDGNQIGEFPVPLVHMDDIPEYTERFGPLPRGVVEVYDIWPEPTWSRSGTEFAFRARFVEGERNGHAGLFRADLLTGEVEVVAWLDPVVNDTGGASYHVDTWDGSAWVERGVLSYGLHYGEQLLELAPYLPDADGEHKVRIRQSGKEAAHVEHLALLSGGRARRHPPAAARHLGTGADVLAELRAPDRRVLDLHEAAMEVRWEGLGPGATLLALIAREEDLSERRTRPFRFPEAEDRAYQVRIDGAGGLVVDGVQDGRDGLGEPLFSAFARPQTGHPHATVSGWVKSDGQRLYAALDFAVDNTRDADADWGAIEVRTAEGWREYRVREGDATWGRVGFGETGGGRYPHKLYEWSVPLAEIGAAVGDVVEVRFSAYGTAALFEEPPPLMPIGSTDWAEPLWVPFERSLLFVEPFVWAFGVYLDEENRHEEVFRGIADWGVWESFFTRSGRKYVSYDGNKWEDPETPCNVDTWLDQVVFDSLLNLTAELRVRRSEEGGGFELRGVASDRHFSHAVLEYAPAASPNAWRPIAPASRRPVLDGVLGHWVPPGPGSFLVRLSVFDLAGNVGRAVRRISWSDTPSLTDLYVEPDRISPNGDGVADAAEIHYRVLAPVHLDFEVFNEGGQRVRTLRRDHDTVGVEATVAWDGRDDRGLPLPDGTYRIAVLGYELFVGLDTTPPEVTLAFAPPYHPTDRAACGADVTPQLVGGARDASLARLVLAEGEGATPFQWVDVGSWSVPEGEDSQAVEVSRPPAEVVGRSFRLEAFDAAGNRAAVATSLPRERLVVGRFGSHLALASGTQPPLRAVEYRDPLGVSCAVLDPIGVPPGALRFEVAETLAAALGEVWVDWRLSGQAGWTSVRAAEWTDPDGLVPRATPPDHQLGVVWRPQGVPAGETVTVRLRAVDAALREHLSNAFLVEIEGNEESIEVRGEAERPFPNLELASLVAAAVEAGALDEAADLPLWVSLASDSVFESARLWVESEDDPRYRVPVEAELVALGDRVALFRLAAWAPCTEYRGRAEGRTVDGSTLDDASAFRTDCLGIGFTSTPVWASACGDPSPHRRRFTVTPNLHRDLTLQLLTVARRLPDGREDVLFSVNRPANHTAYTFELDPRDYPEGTLPFVARLTTLEGDERAVPLDVVMDVTPPEVALTFPVEGQRVCGRQFRPQGRIVDAGGFVASLELAPGLDPAPGAWRRIEPGGAPGADGELVFDPAALSCGCEAGSRRRGELFGNLGTYGDACPPVVPGSFFCLLAEEPFSGDASLRLRVFDEAGYQTCTETSFFVDGLVERPRVEANPLYLSPNGDGVLDEISALVTSEEPATVDVTVHRGFLSVDGPILEPGTVSTLAGGLSILDAVSLAWDGFDDLGARAADGTYFVVGAFRDGCENPAVEWDLVIVDTAPPAAEIVYPRTGDPLATVVEVTGTATDEHFQRWSLSVGTGVDPATWQPLGEGAGEVEEKVLGRWNTFGLASDFVLRLLAFDRAGNVSDTRVPLRLDARVEPISDLEALPTPFSPNGDGRREEAAVRFGLSAESDVSLVVLDLADQPVRTLAGGRLAAGAGLAAWDGRGDSGQPLADGTYQVRLRAALAAQPGVTQEERVTVELDATPPRLTAVRPLPGEHLRPQGSLTGSVEDANLVAWQASLARDPAAPVWEPLDEGTRSVVERGFARLDGAADGEYVFRLAAGDAGESESELAVPFVVDGTPPAVELTAPAADALIGATPVAVLGSVEDDHLAAWWLELAPPGVDPVWTVLAAGEAAPPTPLLLWDASGVAEGPYQLRLRARDRAGNESVAAVAVAVDRSPPVAAIAAPADGAFVKAATPVAGTASDANFLDYRLEVAPGAAASGGWVEVGRGGQPVDGGLLLDWKALPPDGEHSLRLVVRDRAGNQSEARVALTVDLTPPAPPAGLAAERVGHDDVRLTWTANGEGDLVGYHVLRNGQRQTAAPIAPTRFDDLDLAHGPYRYTVTAVDRAGWESAPSAPADVEVDLVGPEVRIALPGAGSAVSGRVAVRGTAYAPRDFAEYRLSVGAGDGGGGWQLLRRSPVPVSDAVLGEWDASGLADGAPYTLLLEADDLAGNRSEARVAVTVDHRPPGRPEGLTAAVEGADVLLAWQPVPDDDLAGYLVYRDGVLLGAEGAEDLRALAIAETASADRARPDGTFVYQVAAIDRAGNLGPASDPAEATLESRAPRAVLVEPANGTRFDRPLFLRAVSEDRDVARVSFEWRPAGGAAWSAVGEPDPAAPFETTWDPAGLAEGDYELRAVATDAGERSDPDPATIAVTYTDVTRPGGVTALSAAVDGGEVTLAWTPADDPEVTGVHVDRVTQGGSRLRLTAEPLPAGAASFTDRDVADGDHRYEVLAIDDHGNEAEPATVAAHVYTPALAQPYTPTLATSVELAGEGAAGAAVEARRETAGGSLALPGASSGPDGRFTLAPAPLERGENAFLVRLTDADGDRSKEARVVVVGAAPPAPPTGLAAVAAGYDVTLGWDLHPEPDVLGYRPFREGEALLGDEAVDLTDAEASSEDGSFRATRAIDGSTFFGSPWFPLPNDERPWIVGRWPQPAWLTAIEIEWYEAIADYDVELWDGRAWVPVLAVRGDDRERADHELPQPYVTDRMRVTAHAPASSVGVYELRATHRPLLTERQWTETLGDGVHVYTVTAVDADGFESAPSAPAEARVGDAEAPEAVELTAAVDGARVTLTWTASAAPDLASYELFRDGAKIADHFDLGALRHEELRPAGTYGYRVRAVDAVGNAGPFSNLAEATVAGAAPAAPRDLAVAAVAAGRALDLAWAPGDAAPVFLYRVWRGEVAGGPYEPIAETAETTLRDGGLANGVTYHYVVTARDEAGNESGFSNEAAGTPGDTLPPQVPALHFPAAPGRPHEAASPPVTLVGYAERGVRVELSRGGRRTGEATARFFSSTWSRFLGTTPLELRLSPDGTATFVRTATGRFVHSWDTGALAALSAIPGTARWSGDGSRLVYPAGGAVRAWRRADGGVEDLVTLDAAVAAIPAPEGPRLAIVGSRGGASGLWLADPAAASWQLLVPGAAAAFDAASIEWSPDGGRLAYRLAGPPATIEAVDAATAARVVVEAAAAPSPPRWSPDGGALVYGTLAEGAERVLRYRFADGDVAALSPAGETARWPVWTPDGNAVAYAMASSGEVVLVPADGGGAPSLVEWISASGLEWGRSGYLLAGSGTVFYRIEPPGRVVFPETDLTVGENVFTAVAADGAGNRSAASPPVVVRLLDDARPDLVVPEGGIVVLPAVPVAGQPARVAVTVTNRGETFADPSEAEVVASGPGGWRVVLAAAAPLPALDPGAGDVLLFDLAPPAPGAYRVDVVVDPEDAVDEADETNNRAALDVLVVGTAGPALFVDTDRASYAPGATVGIAVELANGGTEPLSGELRLRIEDLDGFLVEELPARPAALPAGSVDIEAASWPSTGVLAGDYRVVAELVDGGGARLAEAAAGFRLEAEVGLVAAVASDRALYRPGEPVRLTATVRHAAGNAVLAGLSARLTLRGPDGAAVAEWPRALPDLLPGGTASFDVEWASGGAAPGGYAVELEALRDGVAAASASGGFELAAAPAGLSGTLTVAQPAPAIGLPLTVAFTVVNGSEPRTALPLAVRLVEPAAAAEVAAQTLAADLAAGAAFSGEAVFATGALQPRSYLVLLQAELPGPQVVTLAAVAVEPADIAPPELADPRPSDGAFVADLEVEVGAAVVDRLSPLATVEVAVDGGPFAAATPTRPAESRWGRRVVGLAEGPHAYVVRGRDRAGNEAEIAAAFTVDRTPPAIVVAGVEDGGRYPGAVVPTVTVEEAHPAAEAEITLDGAPFVSGTPVEAAGAHLLRAIAEDLAGNRSERAVAFEIGGGAPELAAEKTAALAVDADGDGAASPGDEIAYTVTIENRGGGEATAVTLTDPLPEHTALVAGSVTATRGSVAGSGEGGEVVVELGTLEAGGTATVELRVRVGHPLPAGVDRVVNQGVVTSAELPALPTDDPAAGGDRDATVTMVVAAPRLVAEKTAALADDADGDGAPSPGDTLEYRVVVRNAGNAAATAVAFADPVPAHTTLVAGSATASQGTVVAEAPVTAELGEIAGGGASAEVRFRVVIDDPIAAGVRSLHNQGMASSAELPEVPTDDPAVDGAADPTVTAVSAAPDLVVEKTATLFADTGGDGHASPGDTLLYRVRVANRGNTAATATRLLDVLSEHLALDADSVQSSRGTVSGGAAGEPLQVEVGELAAGEEAVLSFQAAVAEPFPSDVLGVANRARVETAELPPVLSDDPATAEPGDPTVTEVFVTPRLSVGPVTIGEAEGSAVFAVALDRAGNRPVRVAWSTSDETARAGADYRADSGTLELPPGATAATIAVELVDDLADEPEETFRLLLDEVLGADADQESALATLVDDDPAPAVSVRDAAVTEGDVGESTAAVVVELATPSGFDIAVPWTTADGSALAAEDYRAASGTLAIPAGQSAGVVEIEVLADERDEPAESFFVRLGEPMAAVVGDGEAVVTIADDDPPPALLAAPASVDEPPSGGAAVAAVTVRLAAASGFEVAVSWATADGTARAGEDYVAAAGTLVFPPGTLERVATVEVLGDGRDEDDETFSLAFSGAVHAVAPAPAAVTIRDLDPPPAVSLGDGAAAEGDAASAALRLPATLSAPSGRGVRVDWTTVAGGTAEAGVDYLPGGGTLVFAPGETSAELEVSVLGDRVDERDETVFVELAAPLAATLGDGAGVGTIHDDDEARLSIADVAVDEGDEGAADALFEVRLSTESDRSVAVDYATGDGTATAGDDYTASEGRLDFPAGETRRSVAVPVLGDTLLEPDEESFTVVLSSPSEAELGDAAATGTIRDDEACYGPELIVDGGAEAGTAAAWTVVEGDAWSWRGEDPAPAAGDAAFAAGETAAAELAQTVDVAAYRVRIDATPGQRFAFSARLRTGDETPPDVARVVVEYRDSDDAVVLDAFDSGELVSPFEWRRVDDVRAAPAGTGWVRVRLLARRAGDEGEADVFFDEVSLRSLRAPVLVVADAVAVEGGAGNSRATTAADFVVTLSCPYHQAVRVAYATADGTAVAGDDYVATAGTLVLAPGDTAALVSVPVVADSEHELHETFTLELSGAEPADEVVVLDAAGVGTIGNDDFCPRSPGFWKTHQELWPARELVLGGVRYGEAAMAAFLDAKGGDATLTLARQLVATRLNLLVGSDPFVLPTVAAADEFLALFPPGSNPQKGDKQAGNAIKDGLDAYNNLDCREDPVVP